MLNRSLNTMDTPAPKRPKHTPPPQQLGQSRQASPVEELYDLKAYYTGPGVKKFSDDICSLGAPLVATHETNQESGNSEEVNSEPETGRSSKKRLSQEAEEVQDAVLSQQERKIANPVGRMVLMMDTEDDKVEDADAGQDDTSDHTDEEQDDDEIDDDNLFGETAEEMAKTAPGAQDGETAEEKAETEGAETDVGEEVQNNKVGVDIKELFADDSDTDEEKEAQLAVSAKEPVVAQNPTVEQPEIDGDGAIAQAQVLLDELLGGVNILPDGTLDIGAQDSPVTPERRTSLSEEETFDLLKVTEAAGGTHIPDAGKNEQNLTSPIEQALVDEQQKAAAREAYPEIDEDSFQSIIDDMPDDEQVTISTGLEGVDLTLDGSIDDTVVQANDQLLASLLQQNIGNSQRQMPPVDLNNFNAFQNTAAYNNIDTGLNQNSFDNNVDNVQGPDGNTQLLLQEGGYIARPCYGAIHPQLNHHQGNSLMLPHPQKQVLWPVNDGPQVVVNPQQGNSQIIPQVQQKPVQPLYGNFHAIQQFIQSFPQMVPQIQRQQSVAQNQGQHNMNMHQQFNQNGQHQAQQGAVYASQKYASSVPRQQPYQQQMMPQSMYGAPMPYQNMQHSKQTYYPNQQQHQPQNRGYYPHAPQHQEAHGGNMAPYGLQQLAQGCNQNFQQQIPQQQHQPFYSAINSHEQQFGDDNLETAILPDINEHFNNVLDPALRPDLNFNQAQQQAPELQQQPIINNNNGMLPNNHPGMLPPNQNLQPPLHHPQPQHVPLQNPLFAPTSAPVPSPIPRGPTPAHEVFLRSIPEAELSPFLSETPAERAIRRDYANLSPEDLVIARARDHEIVKALHQRSVAGEELDDEVKKKVLRQEERERKKMEKRMKEREMKGSSRKALEAKLKLRPAGYEPRYSRAGQGDKPRMVVPAGVVVKRRTGRRREESEAGTPEEEQHQQEQQEPGNIEQQQKQAEVEVVEAPKKRRGRPPKKQVEAPAVQGPAPLKRGRGRPKKQT